MRGVGQSRERFMSTWAPASSEHVVQLLELEMQRLHPAHLRRFQAMRVQPHPVPVASRPGETVVVVAEHAGQLLYYSDVEHGWELESPNEHGSIDTRGANQFTLSHLMHQLFGDPGQVS